MTTNAGFCFECRRTVDKSTMEFAGRAKYRKVCADCAQRIKKAREEAKQWKPLHA